MSKLGAWLEKNAPPVHRFLTRKDKPWPAVREIGAGILGILLLVGLLYGTTGQSISGGYPVVVVTSGSMMHCKQGSGVAGLGKDCDPTVYGRVGTIDPGDLVFVRHVSSEDGIDTKAQQDPSHHYGDAGDVIVYRPHIGGIDQQRTPIIHRALFWLDTASMTAYDRFGGQPISAAEVQSLAGCPLNGLLHGGAASAGFVTRGDNNGVADQCAGFSFDPVRLDYILGKARGELPWIGLVKLWVDDLTHGTSDFNNAGGDSKVMLLVTVIVLVGTPWTIDILVRRGRRSKTKAEKDDGKKGS